MYVTFSAFWLSRCRCLFDPFEGKTQSTYNPRFLATPTVFIYLVNMVIIFATHARIQKIPSGGGGSCNHFSRQRISQRAIQTFRYKKQLGRRGPLASRWRSVTVFLMKHITTWDFQTGPNFLPPSSLDLPMRLQLKPGFLTKNLIKHAACKCHPLEKSRLAHIQTCTK